MTAKRPAGEARLVALLITAAVGISSLSVTVDVRREGQPVADQGRGRYRNPILAGNFPDPSVVRVGADYYMTHSSNGAAPGLLVWHSRDLVNWEPLGPALKRYMGDVWAPEIVHFKGLFYIYFPAYFAAPGQPGRQSCYVVTAASASGPWSEPVDLGVAAIDPGHAVDDAGNRYLYVDSGRMIRLAPDGLSTEGELQKVYDGWTIPAEWNVECKCLESPKIVTRGGSYYLLSAEGGTAGPSTSHMIVVARAKSPAGPWENSPQNPLLRTASRSERWWSQGHGTLIEAADGSWWVMYHAFENNFRTLGRQTLLMPIEWTKDGWPRIPSGLRASDLLRKPAGEDVGHGLPLSDDFAGPGLGLQWRAWDGTEGRASVSSGELRLTAAGSSIEGATVLTLMPANHSYEVGVEVEIPDGAQGGLLLHYDKTHFAGAAIEKGRLRTFVRSQPADEAAWASNRVFLKLRNIEHDVSAFWSPDGKTWTRFRMGFEMSGYHHDTFADWSTLRVAFFASGEGTVVFRKFRYQGLDHGQ